MQGPVSKSRGRYPLPHWQRYLRRSWGLRSPSAVHGPIGRGALKCQPRKPKDSPIRPRPQRALQVLTACKEHLPNGLDLCSSANRSAPEVHLPRFQVPRLSRTLEHWVHDPIILGNDPMFSGSWRLQVDSGQMSRTRGPRDSIHEGFFQPHPRPFLGPGLELHSRPKPRAPKGCATLLLEFKVDQKGGPCLHWIL